MLLGRKGSVAVRVDIRAGEFADRSEVRCELRFFSIQPGRWKIVRISELGALPQQGQDKVAVEFVSALGWS